MWKKFLCKIGIHKFRRTYEYGFCKPFMGITSIVIFKCEREGCGVEAID